MQIRDWLDNLSEATEEDDEVRLRIILKAGNEVEIVWTPSLDSFGTDDEITNGNYMVDARSIAAIQYIE